MDNRPYKYADLIDMARLGALMDSFSQVIGIANAVIDVDGVVLTQAGWQEACAHFHRMHPDTCRLCLESDTALASSMTRGLPFAVYNCHNGLVDTAAPIVVDGVHVANVFTGQFFTEPPDLDFFRAQARRHGFDEATYLAAIARVPIIPRQRVEAITRLYAELAAMLADQGLDRMRLRRTAADLEALNKALEDKVALRTRDLEEAHAGLARREALLRQIFDTSSVAIMTVDPAGRVSRTNRRAAEMFALPEAALLGMSYPELVAEEQRSQGLAGMQALMRGEIPLVDIERRYRRGDGSEFWGHLLARRLLDDQGRMIGLVGTLADITQRKLAEETLRRQEEHYRAIADNGSALIWMAGLDKRCYYFNRVWLEFTGRGLAEEQGDGWAEGVHPDDLAHCLDSYVRAFDERRAFTLTYRLRRHDGVYRWIIDRGMPRFDEDGLFLGYVGHCLDITEHKEREDALRRANERLDLAQRAAGAGLWDWDIADGRMTWSDEFYRLLGLDPVMDPPTLDNLRGRLHPEDREAVEARIAAAIRAHAPLADEFRVRLPNGDIRWLATHGRCAYGPDGQPWRLSGICLDVSERQRIAQELERYRQGLEERVAERTRQLAEAKEAAEAANRAKSVFLANMSHELRTPLNAILGFAQLMERDSALPESAHANLRTINRSGQHLLALINDVLEISKIEAGGLRYTPTTLDLPGLLDNLLESMRHRAREKGLALRLETSPELPRHIDSDISKLRQILLNLLSNAIKYTRHGEVALSVRPLSTARHPTLEFSVRDTGSGIPADELERIFQAFYQTETGIRLGEGTGLGLTISREYAQLLGGNLTAESMPGQGSVFRLTLPLAPAAAPREAREQGRVLALAPGQPAYRLLVVEDEPVNQDVLRQLLEEVGFQVRCADDGQAAVTLFQQWRPHFIWMDMRMPVLDGFAATRAIRALPGGAGLPIVAFTASAFEEDRRAILAAGCDDVLSKPLDENRLFDLLARHLGAVFVREATAAPSADEPDLGRLPQTERQRLCRLARQLDPEAFRAAAETLLPDYPGEARQLMALAGDYRFDRIIASLCD